MSVCSVCGGRVSNSGCYGCGRTVKQSSPDVALTVEEVKVELTDEEYKTVYEKSDEHGIKNETLRQCVNWFIKDRIKAERERIEKEVEQLENDPNTYEDNNLPEDMIYKFKQIIKGACK